MEPLEVEEVKYYVAKVFKTIDKNLFLLVIVVMIYQVLSTYSHLHGAELFFHV